METVSKNRFKASKTRIAIGVFIAAILLVVITAAICSHLQDRAIKTEFQIEIYTRLSSAQLKIDNAISRNDRGGVRELALDYERLGTIYAVASSQLFDSYLDTGGWGIIARVLAGIHSDFDLFKQFDGPLSMEEIEFLEQLSDVNDILLTDIAGSVDPDEIKVMSVKSLKEILNTYHVETLQEFLSSR